MTLEVGKELDRKCVWDWLNEVYVDPSLSYSRHTDDEIRIFAHDALVLLKEQEDMIPLSTVAEYLAQYAAPPVRSPLAVYGDLVQAWERFFEGLRKREK